LGDLGAVAIAVALLAAVRLLPPDTSLQQMRTSGTLRACLPSLYPPLVTNDPAAPGLDVDLLRAVARELGVELTTVTQPAMGQSFNPRDWRVTRAACDILAGGVADTPQSRGFLDVTAPYATTGWAWLARTPQAAPQLRHVGVLVGLSGLDRIGLATWLHAAGAEVAIVGDPAALVQGLADGRFETGIAERLSAIALAQQQGWASGWMPPDLPRVPLVLGLWKGDLTLKRAIADALVRLQRQGTIATILTHYAPDDGP
jgi:polar amino acid transport system substrate-binding protein/cystine transport system substrate-binding protein/membrane-bound lytic murein transglycosylase F